MASGTFAVSVNGAGMSGVGYWTTTDDAANNRTLVDASFTVSKANGFSPTFGNGTWGVSIAGTNSPTSYYFTISQNETKSVHSYSAYVNHNADGTGSAAISVSGGISGTSWTTTTGSTTLTLTDYNRSPAAPSAAPTATRNDAGTTITVLSATATSPITITDYEYRQSTNNSTWGSAISMGTDRTIDVTSLTNTQVYYYQTRAVNADGPGAWSTSQISNGAPATITATRTGRNVAVTAGNATGSGITGYYVQYSTNSGSTWSTAQIMTSQAYTYTSLTPALTYLFRVYAAAPSGDTGKTVSAGIFVPAGGKRWNGSAFISTSTAKRWNGSAWIDLTVAKRWNGSTWTDLS